MYFADRLAKFALFVMFTFMTFGIYPIYFWVVRTEQQIDLLTRIERNTRQ